MHAIDEDPVSASHYLLAPPPPKNSLHTGAQTIRKPLPPPMGMSQVGIRQSGKANQDLPSLFIGVVRVDMLSLALCGVPPFFFFAVFFTFSAPPEEIGKPAIVDHVDKIEKEGVGWDCFKPRALFYFSHFLGLFRLSVSPVESN